MKTFFVNLYRNFFGLAPPMATGAEPSADAKPPADFASGLELRNDARTPMLFVVEVLRRHAGLSERAAIEVMLRVHSQGQAWVALADDAGAVAAAAAISAEALAAGWPLVCLPVVSVRAGAAPLA